MNAKSIPHLPINTQTNPLVEQLVKYLDEIRYQGTYTFDHGRRLIGATDNSIYQLLPQAILYPQDAFDIDRVNQALADPKFKEINITPRGGGTGTNGQSLTTGVSLDISRHLHHILNVNLEEGWVEVEAGVILDQLNDHLAHTGYFFAPNLSPSSRATIGGMINTDAAGKGSRIYGKTSDHILELELSIIGGQRVLLRPISGTELRQIAQSSPQSFEAQVALPLLDLARREAVHIDEIFPKLSRFMTGYNLKMMYDEKKDILDLTRLIAGSEGSLGVVTKAKLKLTPIPTARRLILLSYESFQDALGSAQLLLDQEPSAIETIDHNILNLARADASYESIKPALEANGLPSDRIKAINLVEFEGHSIEEVEESVSTCLAALRPHYGEPNTPIADTVAVSATEQEALWGLRKRGVGLLAARPGKRKPIAFVEDTVVPPERLSEYIADFTALLDREGVEYGLFGHVDVGCLHVRPALDLRDPHDEKIFRRISDEVSDLVRSYGGLIWGEHGKGIRSAYSPDYFQSLYPVLQEVKRYFDPRNQLNPGKVATPDNDSELLPLNSPLRAHQDRLISADNLKGFEVTVTCNGNGQCFDYHPDHLMCPSAKVTRDRLHSPKGRAGMMRAWLAALSENGYRLDPIQFDPHQLRLPQGFSRVSSVAKDTLFFPFIWIRKYLRQYKRRHDLSQQVYEAMSGCLSCKACTTACPVKVDVPQFKSRFLHLFYQRYPRPLRDYLIGWLEPLASLMSHTPWIWNRGLQLPGIATLNRRLLGLTDPPTLSAQSALSMLKTLKAPPATPQTLAKLSQDEKLRSVILIPDAFNAFFDAQTLVDSYESLKALGFTVFMAPFSSNGKGLHVKGRLNAFKRVAGHTLFKMKPLMEYNIPMVCIDPAVALTYRDEYVEALGKDAQLPVLLVQEWLIEQLEYLPKDLFKDTPSISLFTHCTERSLSSTTHADWITIFDHLGIDCTPAAVGCCGMCGVYGHETEHAKNSIALFESSWAKKLAICETNNLAPVVTGYSCRAQIKRCTKPSLKQSTPRHRAIACHPLSHIAQRLRSTPVQKC